MPYYPESESPVVYDLSEIELNQNHPLAGNLILATVGGHDYAAGADVVARNGTTFRDMTFPWGFQGSVPYTQTSPVGEIVTMRQDSRWRNIYREFTIIQGHINTGGDGTGQGALFGLGSSPTTNFDYQTQALLLGTFNTTALETVQKHHNGINYTYAIYRTPTGIFERGTVADPVAHTYAVTKSYNITPLIINGTSYPRPFVFYKDGEIAAAVNADPNTVASSYFNPFQTNANPSYLSGTEATAGNANQRLYGYHGFTYVFDCYLPPEVIHRLSVAPMSLMQSRDDMPFAISFVDLTTLDTEVTFTGVGNLLAEEPSTTTSVTGEISSSFTMALDDIVQRDFEGTGNIIMGPITFGGAGDLQSAVPFYEITVDEGSVFDGVGALAVSAPGIESLGTVYTTTGVSFSADGGLVSTATAFIEGTGGSTITVQDISFASKGNVLLGQPILIRTERVRTLRITPDNQLALEFEKPIISVWRVVDILNPDESVFMDDVGVIEGNVSVDMGRAERRAVDITFDNYDRSMSPQPGGFWYDKVIRVRRGIELDNAVRYEFDLGYFMIDRIQGNQTHTTVQVSGRDYTKKMLVAKATSPMSLFKGTPLNQLMVQILYMSGIPASRVIIPLGFNPVTSDVMTFDGDASAWDMLKTFLTPYNMDLFFDRAGNLVIKPQVDPLTTAAVARFGVGEGNMVSMERSTNDSELFNSVTAVQESSAGTVSGATPGTTVAPPSWTAENREPSSPTRIAAIGRRSKRITSPLIKDINQAYEMANQFLKIAALEQYELTMETLNYPWLDVGNIVVVVDPEASAVDPENYLLTQLDISIELGPMSATAKRITVVG